MKGEGCILKTSIANNSKLMILTYDRCFSSSQKDVKSIFHNLKYMYSNVEKNVLIPYKLQILSYL